MWSLTPVIPTGRQGAGTRVSGPAGLKPAKSRDRPCLAKREGLERGSEVKGAGCSCRRPETGSQHQRGGSRPSVLLWEHSNSLFWPPRAPAMYCSTWTQMQGKHLHTQIFLYCKQRGRRELTQRLSCDLHLCAAQQSLPPPLPPLLCTHNSTTLLEVRCRGACSNTSFSRG